MTIEEQDKDLEEAIAMFSVDQATVDQASLAQHIPGTGSETKSQFEIVVRDTGLAPAKAQVLLKNFQHYFELAGEWEQRAKTLVVMDETQTIVMKLARAGRLHLREKRLAIERTRKELKEQSLREGKAIDGIANVLKALIIPIEEYLGRQENFVQLRESERAEAKRLENERLAEEARIATEKAEAEERIRIRLENERLRAEAEAREKVLRAERESADLERRRHEDEMAKERAKAKEERGRIEEELQKTREVERQKEEELQRMREVERQKMAEEERRIEALKHAGDNEKLRDFERVLRLIEFPSVTGVEASQAVADVCRLLKQAVAILMRAYGEGG